MPRPGETNTLYFNEWEPYAAAWLGDLWPRAAVDRRDVRTLTGGDVRPYRRVHLFAGIGGWEYALHLAGWPAARPVWTGSCPCQPFSGAGRGRGVDDERHLWPDMFRLVRECRPPVVFGEQVASPAGRDWLAGVRRDLEGVGYAVGAADLCAAGVAAPHLRQRLYWVADAGGERRLGSPGGHVPPPDPRRADGPDPHGHAGERRSHLPGLADPDGGGLPQRVGVPEVPGFPGSPVEGAGRSRGTGPLDGPPAGNGRVEDADGGGHRPPPPAPQADQDGPPDPHPWPPGQLQAGPGGPGRAGGFWTRSGAVWCRDGVHRRVEPGVHPLVDEFPGRVGQVRAYGNAIVPELAAAFVRAFLTAEAEPAP